MAKKYDKDQLLADFKTGAFTQRELAHKYKLSVARISALTKGVPKDLENIVNTKSQIEHELSLKSVQEVNAVSEQVNIRTKHLQFIHNATLKNASVMMKKINDKTPVIEHKMAQETINKAGEALGVIEKGGSNINFNNTNAQQINAEELPPAALRKAIADRGLPVIELDE